MKGTLARLNIPEFAASPDGDASKASSFQSDARFALNILPTLTSRPGQIKQLRQAILNLAVRGKLVPQWAAEGGATTTISAVAAANPHARKYQSLAVDVPYELPENWRWIHFGLLIAHSDAGWSPKTENHPRTDAQWGVLKVSAVSWGRFSPIENKQVLPNTEPRDQAILRKGDFLLSRANTAELVARAVVVEDDPVNLMFSDKIVRLTLTQQCNHRFLLFVNNDADFARHHYATRASGVSPSMKNISREVIYELPIPFPPLAEQQRIIAKVDELMKLCDQIESSLTCAENTRSRLLEALLHVALQRRHDSVIDFEAARQRLLEKRQAVACRVVQRLSQTKGFGRVRAVKLAYFAEAHCGIALGGQWGRANFGPYDDWIRSLESHAKTADWFSTKEHALADGGTRIEYIPGTNLAAKAQQAAEALGEQADEFERVLNLLADLSTEESEIVATLFAAWNDLLLEGKPASNDIVITEFRQHWAKGKERFLPAQLKAWLGWMRKRQLVPKGQGPNTRLQGSLI